MTTWRSRASPCGTEGRAIVCQGSGYADHRRGRVEDSACRIQIIFYSVIGERVHNHPGSVLCECFLHVLCSADGIAYVMQTIEVSDEVVVLTGIVCGFRCCEWYVPQACFLGPFVCRQY